MTRNIHLLWPTVRIDVMVNTHKHWINSALNPSRILTTVAVNTEKEKSDIEHLFYDVILVGNDKKGPANAAYALSRHIQAENDDIIILVSDDFFSPHGWDKWVCKQFKDSGGAIIVNDGYQVGGCVTIPIMTFKTLLKLNRIIYHPSYVWQYSDAELYDNLKELRYLRDLRNESPVFEHRHWANGKRKVDAHDRIGLKSGSKDTINYQQRSKMSLGERLNIEC